MKAEYINPFLEAANLVFSDLLQEKLIRGKIQISQQFSAGNIHDLGIYLTFDGSIQGRVLYALSEFTAKKIFEKLLRTYNEEIFLQEYRDVLGELANMITGNAMNIFLNKNQFIEVSVPEVIDFRIKKVLPENQLTIRLNMYSQLGMLEINVSLTEKNSKF